jgi:hypothetical protein
MSTIAAASAILGTIGLLPADAQDYRPGCHFWPCVHGIILPGHRVCVRWEVFGGERHCIKSEWRRWR